MARKSQLVGHWLLQVKSSNIQALAEEFIKGSMTEDVNGRPGNRAGLWRAELEKLSLQY